MVDELESLLEGGFSGASARVRCFAHSLNLVVKVHSAVLVGGHDWMFDGVS
jgi:hypothetical protein